MPNQVDGALVHPMSGTELSRVRTEFRLHPPEPINSRLLESRGPTLLCNQLAARWIRSRDHRNVRRARLTAFFDLLEGGLKLGEQELSIFGSVGDGDLPILYGVGFVVESSVGASEVEVGPKLFFGMALLVEQEDLESAIGAGCSQQAGAIEMHIEHAAVGQRQGYFHHGVGF
jgi:hypothetical protein